MKVLVTGATGFVGTHLSKRLAERGHTVLPVSRGPHGRYDWSDGSLARGVSESDAIVHLAGENLFAKRWTDRQKSILRASRIDTTKKLAALAAKRKPSAFLVASAVGYYGASADRRFVESDGPGADFLAQLCADWEGAARAAVDAGVRTAFLRTGVVLGQSGGALAKMLPIFRLGLGGPLGDGEQWMSWIHVDDLVDIYVWSLENERASGPLNGTAPNPVTMNEFARTLGRVLHRPAIFRAPAFALRATLGEVSDVLLTGQHVTPRRALDLGFRFAYTQLEPALASAVFPGKARAGA